MVLTISGNRVTSVEVLFLFFFSLQRVPNSDLIAQVINPHEVRFQYLVEIIYTIARVM